MGTCGPSWVIGPYVILCLQCVSSQDLGSYIQGPRLGHHGTLVWASPVPPPTPFLPLLVPPLSSPSLFVCRSAELLQSGEDGIEVWAQREHSVRLTGSAAGLVLQLPTSIAANRLPDSAK